jgi:hypothetical protein
VEIIDSEPNWNMHLFDPVVLSTSQDFRGVSGS